ncbi:hypothetical protein GCM10020216_079090 [Nonomuraea helvata]
MLPPAKGRIKVPSETHLNPSVPPGGVQTDGQMIKGPALNLENQAPNLRQLCRGGGI